jgi:hypothetical protein
VVGHLDCHEYVYLFGALNLVSGRLNTRLVERPTQSKMHRAAKYRYLQAAFARHLREVARRILPSAMVVWSLWWTRRRGIKAR